MKKLGILAAIALCAASVSCQKAIELPLEPGLNIYGALEGRVQDLDEVSFLKVKALAEGGISSLSISITSPTLSGKALSGMGLAEEFDLAWPGKMENAIRKAGLPAGEQVAGKTEVEVDLTPLLNKMKEGENLTADHRIILGLSDRSGQNFSASIFLHQESGAGIVVKTLNLWTRTATVVLDNHFDKNSKLRYRVKGQTKWIDAEKSKSNSREFTIAPVWTKSTNEAKITVYVPDAATGLKAETLYEFSVTGMLGRETAKAEYCTPAGDVLPNNNFTDWYTRNGMNNGLYYPNAAPVTSPDGFWDSGNNTFAKDLCYPVDGGGAMLKSQKQLGIIACGNLFSGDFDFKGTDGSVYFGKHFNWTALPTALVIKYSLTTGKIDCVQHDPKIRYLGKQDNALIQLAVVNWKSQHLTRSGLLTYPTGTWDMTEEKVTDEGKVLGYCSEFPDTDTKGIITERIPFYWYENKPACPKDAKYNIVVSISNSRRGGYLTGYSGSRMQIAYIGFEY